MWCLALGVTFYTFMLTEIFPLTTDFSRPYASASAVLLAGIAAIAVFGFCASRAATSRSSDARFSIDQPSFFSLHKPRG